jgi:hypothetical protein
MTIFGKRLSEYVAFSRFFLILIPIVGIIRLALSLNGTPNSTAKWFSITALVWIAVLYYSIRAQITGFGSYSHLLPVFVLLQSVAAQLIIVGAIVLAIFTGTDNIFSAPEYAFGSDGKTWFHVAAHLLIGTTVAPLICWLVGCLVMFVTKKLARGERRTNALRA